MMYIYIYISTKTWCVGVFFIFELVWDLCLQTLILTSIQSIYLHVQHNQVLLALSWFLQFIGLFIEIAWFVQRCCIDAQPSNFSFNSWPVQQTLTMINLSEYCKLRFVYLLNNCTFLSGGLFIKSSPFSHMWWIVWCTTELITPSCK